MKMVKAYYVVSDSILVSICMVGSLHIGSTVYSRDPVKITS
jgi:hypothetical protein